MGRQHEKDVGGRLYVVFVAVPVRSEKGLMRTEHKEARSFVSSTEATGYANVLSLEYSSNPVHVVTFDVSDGSNVALIYYGGQVADTATLIMSGKAMHHAIQTVEESVRLYYRLEDGIEIVPTDEHDMGNPVG